MSLTGVGMKKLLYTTFLYTKRGSHNDKGSVVVKNVSLSQLILLAVACN